MPSNQTKTFCQSHSVYLICKLTLLIFQTLFFQVCLLDLYEESASFNSYVF